MSRILGDEIKSREAEETKLPINPVPLSKIAERTGFSMADVAFLAQLEESTVCRLWDDPTWLDRIKGRSLQAIIGVVPGVTEYVSQYTLANRRSTLAKSLENVGLQLNIQSMKHLVVDEHIPEQYISNALSAAVQVMERDTRKAAAHLVRFWGREQDFALSFLFKDANNNGLLVDTAPLIEASIQVIEELRQHSGSFHAMVSQANLMHHMTQATGDLYVDSSPDQLERSTAVSYRSSMMGLIMQSNDLRVVEQYNKTLDKSPLLSMVEQWAFPTYTHDTKTTPDFTLPRSLRLEQTTDELIREVNQYNDAYLYYLAHTAIPALIPKDYTFGLRVAELKTSIQKRLESCESAATREECAVLIKKLDADPTGKKGALIAEEW
jgi:hypothetical protein